MEGEGEGGWPKGGVLSNQIDADEAPGLHSL